MILDIRCSHSYSLGIILTLIAIRSHGSGMSRKT